MKKLQEREGFIEELSKIKFQFSDEDLFNELSGPNRVTLSIIHIVDKKNESLSYQSMRVFCLCLKILIDNDFLPHEIIVSEIEILFKKTYFFVFQE